MNNSSDIDEQKQIAYYASKCNAWFSTKLEADKSILAVSSGAEGLLITLLTAFGVNNVTEIILYFASIICFAVSIICMIRIFQVNSTYLESLIQKQPLPKKSLANLDKIGSNSFILGTIFMILISISILFNSINLKGDMVMKKGERKPLHENFSFNNSEKLSSSS